MKAKHIISQYALLACFVGTVPDSATAAIRVGNKSRSYADAYNQMYGTANNNSRGMNVGAATTTADVSSNSATGATVELLETTEPLPIRVANINLANQIIRDDANAPITRDDLLRCAMIYPSGEFEWASPTGGMLRGGESTCVSVVEMRATNGDGLGNDVVLARAHVAAGDSFRCNISDFPEDFYTDAAGEFLFPADRQPTVQDVVAVMNAEQKQNAGFKIAATALIGGISGNMMGKNEIGNDGLFGTNKEKISSSVAGAAIGAAIGAAGAYSGKVAGDTIMSTGINATAGFIIGNVMAPSGNKVLRIEKCIFDDRHIDCLLGYVMKDAQIQNDNTVQYYYDAKTGGQYKCTTTTNTNQVETTDCKSTSVVKIKLDGCGTDGDLDKVKKDQFKKCTTYFKFDKEGQKVTQGNNDNDKEWLKIKSGQDGTVAKEAAAIEWTGQGSKTFGWTQDDWNNIDKKSMVPLKHTGNGKLEKFSVGEYKADNFYPMYRSSDDGGVVDLSNPARMKSSLTGAGVGGALGAFSGYQGAQSDIDDRWTAAVREYKDSLGKVSCFTGKRFLGVYNDVIELPIMIPDNKEQNK